jgi:hypothetical protein
MGTTAEKLTYLNTTKGKIKDSINLTGAGITNQDTFRSYASLLKTGLISIINNGIDQLYSNFPKVSGIGSNLSLTPTYEAPMRNLPLGDTLQNGTPTPSSPIDIQTATGLQNINVCGKNLLPYPYFSGTITNRGITFTPREDGSILVNGTATGQATFALYGNYLEENQKDLTGNYLSGGTNNVKLRAYNHTGSSYTDLGTDAGNGVQINKTTYTTGYIELVVANGTTINNVIIKPMMLNSLDDTSYEPYNDNTYEVNLGKNLFNLTGETHGNNVIVTQTGNEFELTWTGGFNLYLTNIVSNLDSNKTYTISFKHKGESLDLRNGSASVQTIRTGTNNDYTLCSTTVTNINNFEFHFIRSSGTTSTAYIKDIQIEVGSQATSYSPYFTPIELNKINTYQDSIKKSTGKNLFDKDEEVTKYFIDANGVRRETSTAGDYFIEQLFTSNIASNYVISFTNKVGTSYVRFSFFNGDTFISRTLLSTSGESVSVPSGTTKMYIHTDKSETKYFENLQIEVGTTPTTYEPYGKVWYVEKNINKKIFNGSNSDGTWAKQTGYYNCNANLGGITGQGYTNYYSYGNLNTENKFFITTNAFRVNDSTDTLENYITWLSTHNIELYYVSNTPTYDTITNEELIEQLDNLYTAKSQEGTTNISITSEDLPMLLSASALKGDA